MKIGYKRSGMANLVFLEIDGEVVYCGFWYTHLQFIDGDGEEIRDASARP